MAARRRLDAELVRRGLAETRNRAQGLIDEGRVLVNGAPADKPSRTVLASDGISLRGPKRQWASRAAHKLLGALEIFDRAGLKDISELTVLDAGASTGGFTDVLLQRGAKRVFAVDVGYGQLHWRLRQDARVTVMDRTNIRNLTALDLPERPDLVTADLSFISLCAVLPALVGLVREDADLLLMVKPQFEVGQARLKHGVVRDVEARIDAVLQVADCAEGLGWGLAGVAPSPLPGPSGNVEYFVWLREAAASIPQDEVRSIIREGPS